MARFVMRGVDAMENVQYNSVNPATPTDIVFDLGDIEVKADRKLTGDYNRPSKHLSQIFVFDKKTGDCLLKENFMGTGVVLMDDEEDVRHYLSYACERFNRQ